jgi:hypothetical protein
MKADNSTAHVGLRRGEVSVGERVLVYGDQCPSASGRNMTLAPPCVKIAKGAGVVTRIISDDYVEVKFDSGVKFKEGDSVENQSH